MNVNFGLIAPLTARLRGRAKKEMMSRRALADLAAWARESAVAPAEKELDVGRAAMSPRRSAFIDIGTNTILCLIAEIRDTGRFQSFGRSRGNRRAWQGSRSRRG